MSDRSFGKALGELIRQKRKALGLTQIQLAEDAFGSSNKTRRVSELESGLVSNPHPKTIDPIITILKISESELEECARQTKSAPDQDLDRAYREARNLIEAIARQFEHSRPDASFAEIDEFLRTKAKEWIELRERIQHIDAANIPLGNLKSAATNALSNGGFDEADMLLAQAEELQQQDHTLREVRNQAKLRVTRGDISLLKGDKEQALKSYLGAAEFFRPFDEGEMVHFLDELAYRVYETSLRSLDPSFSLAGKLIETALSTQFSEANTKKSAELHYRLSLIYRNASMGTKSKNSLDYLNKATIHARTALSGLSETEDVSKISSARIALANCILEKSKRTKDQESIDLAISLFRHAKEELEEAGQLDDLEAHACNNLGAALIAKLEIESSQPNELLLNEALQAFEAAINCSERGNTPDVWGVAKTNCGRLYSAKAKLKTGEDSTSGFLRIQSISAYLSAIEIYPSTAFPTRFAEAHCGLADVLFDQALACPTTLKEYYLVRAIASYEIATEVFTRERFPRRWASIQMYLGSIFGIHAEMDDVESTHSDYEQAIHHFENALQTFQNINAADEIASCEKTLEEIAKRLQQSTRSTE